MFPLVALLIHIKLMLHLNLSFETGMPVSRTYFKFELCDEVIYRLFGYAQGPQAHTKFPLASTSSVSADAPAPPASPLMILRDNGRRN